MRRHLPLFFLGLLVAPLAACSNSASTAPARPTPAPSGLLSSSPTADASASPSARPALTANRYEQMVLDDGARGLWPLRDVTPTMRFGDKVADLSNPLTPAVDVDGSITPTTGPRLFGTTVKAAAFTARGRLVTPLQTGFTSGDAFTIESWFRADGCSNSWGRAAGTENSDARGREGVSVFYYPKSANNPCRLGVEIWHRDAYVLGCPVGLTAPTDTWVHIATTYSKGTLSCYRNGVLAQRQSKPGAVFSQTAPFDIGSAGSGIAGNLSSGSLAQVAVYGTALPAARLLAHAKAAS